MFFAIIQNPETIIYREISCDSRLGVELTEQPNITVQYSVFEVVKANCTQRKSQDSFTSYNENRISKAGRWGLRRLRSCNGLLYISTVDLRWKKIT